MPKPGKDGDVLSCSFCGKSQQQVRKLIAGPGVYICDECIDLCNEIIQQELGEAGPVPEPTDEDVEAAARTVNEAVRRLQLLALRRRRPEPGQPSSP